jgi:signal-transduction protein with cAMP-binding, CBS, and nucleotidyltransferase domain
MKRVRPEAELWAALEEMDMDGVNRLSVMTDGQMLGLLSRDGIISFLRARRELGM